MWSQALGLRAICVHGFVFEACAIMHPVALETHAALQLEAIAAEPSMALRAHPHLALPSKAPERPPEGAVRRARHSPMDESHRALGGVRERGERHGVLVQHAGVRRAEVSTVWNTNTVPVCRGKRWSGCEERYLHARDKRPLSSERAVRASFMLSSSNNNKRSYHNAVASTNVTPTVALCVGI